MVLFLIKTAPAQPARYRPSASIINPSEVDISPPAATTGPGRQLQSPGGGGDHIQVLVPSATRVHSPHDHILVFVNYPLRMEDTSPRWAYRIDSFHHLSDISWRDEVIERAKTNFTNGLNLSPGSILSVTMSDNEISKNRPLAQVNFLTNLSLVAINQEGLIPIRGW